MCFEHEIKNKLKTKIKRLRKHSVCEFQQRLNASSKFYETHAYSGVFRILQWGLGKLRVTEVQMEIFFDSLRQTGSAKS